MNKPNKRLFDAGLIMFGGMLTIAALDIGVLHSPTMRVLATSLITWLMCSLPVAMLAGHCALSED
jgi:hypothetical protein